MAHLFDAVLFMVLVASAGLGLTSIITGFIAPENAERKAVLKHRVESIFFGISGIVVALVAWLGMILK